MRSAAHDYWSAVVYDYYLQNIATGQFEPDPATPGGTVFDDLNAPSGATPLCPPLQYPSFVSREGTFLGQLTFHGQFAVTYEDPGSLAWSLHRCASRLNLVFGDVMDDNAPVASSRAVVVTRDNIRLHGWFLASLRRFTIRPALGAPVQPVAVTDRRIYIYTRYDDQLWAATLPAPHQRSGH